MATIGHPSAIGPPIIYYDLLLVGPPILCDYNTGLGPPIYYGYNTNLSPSVVEVHVALTSETDIISFPGVPPDPRCSAERFAPRKVMNSAKAHKTATDPYEQQAP